MSEALNIIKASFGGLREVTTSPLWQWDYGQILQITGLDLPQAFEVHFSNSRKSGETVTQIGTDNQVTIPDMYLTSGADIYAFIFLHDGLTDGETEYVIKIPVRERPEPSDIEPTPEQQGVIDQTIAALNNGVAKSETNVTHYPKIVDGYWHVWDAQTEQFVSTGVEAQGEKGDGGLAIFFSVPNKAIPTDANRKIVEDQSINFGVYAFKDGELIDPENVTASAYTYQSGQYSGAINAVVTHSTFERPQWHVSYTLRTSANITLRADSGTQVVNVTVNGVVYKIYFPWSAAKQGVQGEKGDTGEGAVNVFLRDPVTLIPTDADGYHANQQIVSTYVYAFKDGEPCTLTSVTATPVSILLDSTHIQAVDAVITVSGTSALVKYTLPAGTGLRNDRQIPTITAVVDGETHTATMCIVSAKRGETGVGISNIESNRDHSITIGMDNGTEYTTDPLTEGHRITSLNASKLVCGETIEAIGIPVYVSATDIGQYSAYGIIDTGWYVFARIAAPKDVTVSAGTTVTGAAGSIITAGAAYVDVAVRFEVAAESQVVVVEWASGDAETFIFKATDLAVRNLDYRTTFYVYDLSPFITWTYTAASGTFAADKNYYTEADGVYTLAEVTVGETIPADTYYVHSLLHIEGMARNITYKLDEIVDCPVEVALPEIASDGHGAWFEYQLRHNGEYSFTLLPPTEDVKAGTAQTQKIKAGINVVDLHYTEVDGTKIWTLINTHSDIPTT